MIGNAPGGKNMKTLIVYASVHNGNTEKVARAMAEAVHADIVEAKHVNVDKAHEYDLIGFGSGIYNGELHATVLHAIERIPKSKDKKAFVFSTNSFGLTMLNKHAIKMLKERGFTVTGNFACRGYFDFKPLRFFGGIAKGRPNEADLKKARDFVHGLVK